MKLEHRLRAKLTHSTSSKPEPCLEPVFTSKPFKKSPYTVTHKPPTKIRRDTYDAISPPITHQQSLYSLLLIWLVKKAQVHLAPDPNESFVLVSLTGRIFPLLFWPHSFTKGMVTDNVSLPWCWNSEKGRLPMWKRLGTLQPASAHMESLADISSLSSSSSTPHCGCPLGTAVNATKYVIIWWGIILPFTDEWQTDNG